MGLPLGCGERFTSFYSRGELFDEAALLQIGDQLGGAARAKLWRALRLPH